MSARAPFYRSPTLPPRRSDAGIGRALGNTDQDALYTGDAAVDQVVRYTPETIEIRTGWPPVAGQRADPDQQVSLQYHSLRKAQATTRKIRTDHSPALNAKPAPKAVKREKTAPELAGQFGGRQQRGSLARQSGPTDENERRQ